MESARVYCPIRKEWVKALPEEQVRQTLIRCMIDQLGYPPAFMAVEKKLNDLPYLVGMPLPDRRADIICFGKDIHPHHSLYPLLLIECKAVVLTRRVILQVMGYNHYIKAFFIAVANQKEIKVGWFDQGKKEYCFAYALPPYEALLKQARSFYG